MTTNHWMRSWTCEHNEFGDCVAFHCRTVGQTGPCGQEPHHLSHCSQHLAMNELGVWAFSFPFPLCAFLTCSEPLYDFWVLFLFGFRCPVCCLLVFHKDDPRLFLQQQQKLKGILRNETVAHLAVSAGGTGQNHLLCWRFWQQCEWYWRAGLATQGRLSYNNTLALQPMGVQPPWCWPRWSTQVTPAGPLRICNSIFALTLPRFHTKQGGSGALICGL